MEKAKTKSIGSDVKIPKSTRWNRENPEKTKLQKARYYQQHKKQLKLKNKIKYLNNKNKIEYKKKKKEYYKVNRTALLSKTTERRNKRRKEVIDYKGGKCEKCGYDKCIRALEFHHINPHKKEFTINNVLLCKGFSLESIKEELIKSGVMK